MHVFFLLAEIPDPGEQQPERDESPLGRATRVVYMLSKSSMLTHREVRLRARTGAADETA
ncbi:hypothetical protein GCM10010219_60760 [Streptomyces netropsis]|nr:hypothetical protein GCM10010219_60760 [Streptomyces netropsis]